jgi:hypothetical protein
VPQVTIENPILNSAFDAPTRHFRFDDDGITTETEQKRRPSAFFMPIARARKKGEQAHFDTEWTLDRIKPNTEINRIRERVDRWRQGGHVDVTLTTRRLLAYWGDPSRERKLFFCQREAVETAIYLSEVASRYGDAWIDNYLRDTNANFNAGVPRIAFKMATGSGKTVVMAMLIAWQALNKLENRHDARFANNPDIREGMSREAIDAAIAKHAETETLYDKPYEDTKRIRVIDTDYDGQSFFVRHAYFTGADEPYDKLKRALRAEIDEAAWSTLYSTTSRPFAPPETRKIAVKVINHYGDEVLKVYDI